ncbi:16S rRNA processing protein RimM family, putative isoform 2 [Hibiscus syriacus]|uniref:16S rRNA processing protein RimM family, putative isoform 2 n=1 Tax=Hibiscus syriacus TaxID=106335 RepID=A0A6A3BU07_HIBSY|nr:16S rRNA processing protein RimM family, putative isoform 2 [Hibiscus syriacus]
MNGAAAALSSSLVHNKMNKASLLCSSIPISSPPAYFHTCRPLTPPIRSRLSRSLFAFSCLRLSLNRLRGQRHDLPPLQSTDSLSGWEKMVKATSSGKEAIKEVELVEGREHPGKKSWILSFSGIETVDQARQLVGSTLLAEEEDRPHLEEGEFYTLDLVGMRVILKETGQEVGTVVNVFNSGANDLLHVMLKSAVPMPNGSEESSNLAEVSDSGPLVWVPFVEEIVPNVDLNRREMLITPPMGLLELNVRTDERSWKERRQLVHVLVLLSTSFRNGKKEKNFQKRLIAAKRKLIEMEQQRVFHGFGFGEKSQVSLIADQIVNVNSKLLQQALENVEIASKSPADEINSTNKLLSSNNYFGFDPEKVWFLEEERLPAVSSLLEQNRHKILMKSPWEMLQSPVGSGGVINLLSSDNIVENLSQNGIEYIQPLLDAWKEACGSTTPSTIVIPKGTYLLSQATLEGPCKAPIELQVQGNVKAPADPKAFMEPKWVASFMLKTSNCLVEELSMDNEPLLIREKVAKNTTSVVTSPS